MVWIHVYAIDQMLWYNLLESETKEFVFAREGYDNDPFIIGNCYLIQQTPEFGSDFTYQGSLSSGNVLANGTFDFTFTLFDAVQEGQQVGNTVEVGGIEVIDGVFTTDLDIDAQAFSGGPPWLEILVRNANDNSDYSILTPRQPILSVPYAHYAANIPQHNHLDESWYGTDSPLKIEGSYDNDAALCNCA